MKIGIISDTHGTFDDFFCRFFADVDQIWHAGDIGNLTTADQIAQFKPLIAVHGNIDDYLLRREYPKFQQFMCEGVSVLMTHIGNTVEAQQLLLQAKPVIFITGHTHILKVHNVRDVLCINPGAAGYGRQDFRTAIRLEINQTRIHSLEVAQT